MSFSILTAEEILARSVCAITNPSKTLYHDLPPCEEMHDAGGSCDHMRGHPSLGTLCDPRMGPRRPEEHHCLTCGADYFSCQGHPGHIELAAPVFLPQFFPFIKVLLEKLCARCMQRPRGSEECPLGIRKCIGAAGKPCPRCKLHLAGYFACPRGVRRCAGAPKVLWKDGVLRVRRAGADDEDWSAARVRAALPPAHRDLVPSCLEVPPTLARPFSRRMGVWQPAPLTALYSNVVKANEEAREFIADPANPPIVIEEKVMALQNALLLLLDSSYADKRKRAAKLVSLATQYKGKEGRVRRDLLGHRVEFSARSVVIGDPYLRYDEIGIPQSVAEALGYPELVCERNLYLMRALLLEGLPGPEYRKGWVLASIRGALFTEVTPQHVAQLGPGDAVHRWLRDGDFVVMNRQPTLSRASIMAHRVRVLPGSAFRLPPNVTTSYNADFDGDEMNLYAPQSVEAVADIEVLMAMREHLIGPNGTPIAPLIQNSLLAARRMTAPGEIFTHAEACQLLAALDRQVRLPPPTLQARGALRWTGAALFSALLPREFDAGGVDFSFDAPQVFVRRGYLVAGQLSKRDLGSGRGNLLHRLLLRGDDDFLNRANFLFLAYMDMRPFSLGVADCFLASGPPPASEAEAVGPDVGARMMHLSTLNKQRTDALLPRGNAFQEMFLAGSKGAPDNVNQVATAVGPRRVQQMYLGDRALPCVAPGDRSFAALGFCFGNYIAGLPPREMFFDLIAGRRQLVASRRSPAEIGELNRKVSESMQNLKVDYAGRVVGDAFEVVQPAFGGDGIKWSRMVSSLVRFAPGSPHEPLVGDRTRFELPFDLEELIANYSRFRREERLPPLRAGALAPAEVDRLVRATPLLRAVLRKRLFDVQSDGALWGLLDVLEGEIDRGLLEPGEPVGIVAAHELVAEVMQWLLNSFHRVGESASSGKRMYELFYAREAPVEHELRLRFSSPERALAFRALVAPHPHVLRATRVTARDFEVPWARRWERVFGPQPRHGVKLALQKRSLGPPLWDWCRAQFGPGGAMHSHDSDPTMEVIVFRPELVDFKARRGPLVEGQGVDVVLRPTGPALARVFALLALVGEPDTALLSSTDVFDLYGTFGLEAARASIYRQAAALSSLSGVNKRHLRLLVDLMCFSGEVRGAKPTGLGRHTRSPWGRACFTAPLTRLIDAAFAREQEVDENVSFSIVTNKLVSLGSGFSQFALLPSEEPQKQEGEGAGGEEPYAGEFTFFMIDG